MSVPPNASVIVVALPTAATQALVGVLSGHEARFSVRRYSNLGDADAALDAAAFVVLDEAAVLPGDLRRLESRILRPGRASRWIALVSDGYSAARGLLSHAGVHVLLKPVVIDELLTAMTPTNGYAPASPAPIVTAAAPPTRDAAWIRGLADELATPLATVSGYLQLLSADRPGDGANAKWDAVREGLERLRKSVESLRAAGGARRTRPRPGDLHALVLERIAGSRNGTRVLCVTHEPAPALLDDPVAAQAIDAVLDFMVRATTTPVEVTIAVNDADASALFAADSPVLAARGVASLFDPYGIEDPASGLALAEALGLVRSHGGDMAARSQATRIEVEMRFPAAPRP